MSTYGPPAITILCRFSGCVTLLGVMRIGLSGPAPPSPYHSVLLIIAVLPLAVALGNIVKEIAFALCAQLSNWAGFNFRRAGRTLGGTPFRDLRRSDGTWRHLERRERKIVVEWTTRDGACRKRVFRRAPCRASQTQYPLRNHVGLAELARCAMHTGVPSRKGILRTIAAAHHQRNQVFAISLEHPFGSENVRR
jgi:hypothetical protein